ncbi:amidohydrolase [Phytomonospora endophytica]|uniref:Hippurate hydrolase n=1 Tax=Phytomonospora endophytica TaxID=714109 RepID=A0A841FI24_9ACTN|nr:amidohydrolase [Phytomonospora endophytica]MBB6034613.1 hippurate hydrolase [Phytomonospora endophytica]GIG71327.1 hippurate hydrolase [Phytomonospora endophytica]
MGSLDLAGTYRDLHAHPELSLQETRTAALAAGYLRAFGYAVTENVGGTGVVAVLRNGPGPTMLLRADMDALPVEEKTGLPYASTARATDDLGNDVPVMHACGHDVHVTCLLGAAEALAADTSTWRGTLQLVFQPAEETGDGARAMLDDGFHDRFGRPEVVLGQHVSPLPAGMIGLRAGPSFAAADSLRVVLHGRGGHGSRPEACVDPVVMAAATVLRLQTVVSREVPGGETAVLTIGALNAGTKDNVIPDDAVLLLNIRTYDDDVRAHVMGAVERIVNGEAAAAGAPRPPEIEPTLSFPMLVNDAAAVEVIGRGFTEEFGAGAVADPGPVTGSEDVGFFATAAGVPCVYWLLGGADPKAFAGATDLASAKKIALSLPSNHSPLFAPVIEPTLQVGVAALVRAARTWSARTD